jgi:hypothetical protein
MERERKRYSEARRSERPEELRTRTIDFAEKQINTRLKVLSEQSQRFSSTRCAEVVSIDTKSPINSALDSAKRDLNTALAKIKEANTAESARTELKSAIEKTRVFMYINPAISGLCQAGKVLDKIQNKFNPLVKKLKEKGVDTVTLEKELSSAENSILAAIDSYKKVLSNPSSPTNKDLLNSAKAHIKSARTALANFKVELAKIASQLRADNNLRSNQGKETSPSRSESEPVN